MLTSLPIAPAPDRLPRPVQHLGRAPERGFLLSYGEGREENRNEPVQSPGHSVARMTGDLQEKLAISALVHQCAFIGRLMGNPHSTKGREANPKFCITFSRFNRTS
jgi:hypothetical protein